MIPCTDQELNDLDRKLAELLGWIEDGIVPGWLDPNKPGLQGRPTWAGYLTRPLKLCEGCERYGEHWEDSKEVCEKVYGRIVADTVWQPTRDANQALMALGWLRVNHIIQADFVGAELWKIKSEKEDGLWFGIGPHTFAEGLVRLLLNFKEKDEFLG